MPLRLTDLLGGKCCWQVNLSASPITIDLTRHDEPFIQDNYTSGFPPASGLTFAQGFKALVDELGTAAAPNQMSFRRPLHPCATEDLFQFNVYNRSEYGVISLGLLTQKLCKGFITQRVDIKMCPEPTCWEEEPEGLPVHQSSCHIFHGCRIHSLG